MEILIDENEENINLSELRRLKQNGTLDWDEYLTDQRIKWRNIIRYSILEECVGHYNEECRLDTLALLVESKKSTLKFTLKELDIILLFLKYNLGEKMEYVSFIKKALKRLNDSLVVMRRQKIERTSYNEKQNIAFGIDAEPLAEPDEILEQIEHDIENYTRFFINIQEICVNNLYPDATYHRRHSSLQILLLAQKLCNEFKNIEWKEEQLKIIYQCLQLDTYELNKEMAYQLLKHANIQTNVILFNLETGERVQLILDVAFELGRSLRPIDSITAAYMLKISILSPFINVVLDDLLQCDSTKGCYHDYHKVNDNVTNATILKLIILLYRKLKREFPYEYIEKAHYKCCFYGYLFCIRSLLSDCNLRNIGKDGIWQSVVDNIIKLCIFLDESVANIVNNAAPEGYLPMSDETEYKEDILFPKTITPQKVLLCSWRTIKEVSHLFGLLATEASIQINAVFSDELLSKGQIKRIMAHFVSLLCKMKHRGAFEQAYVGFHQLCTRLWQLPDTNLNQLPIHWLLDTLITITGLKTGLVGLYATRRSAGIPFLIQGLLSSAPKANDDTNRDLFDSVMKMLLKFANLENTVDLLSNIKDIMDENPTFSSYRDAYALYMKNKSEYCNATSDIIEIKIHSMNILRALFRHSQFSDIVKPYIVDGLIVAFKYHDSKSWAERNAATLLFSALIVRIFGVQRTRDHINLTASNMMTGKLFFERYFGLLPFILNELQTFVSSNDTIIKSNVQAILLLLSRLYVSNSHETDVNWKTQELRNLVSQCAKSPVHQTRELAARALIPLLTESTAYDTLINLLQEVISKVTEDIQVLRASANLINGYLLQAFEILKKFPSVKELLKPYQSINFLSVLQLILNSNRATDGFNSFPLATIYVDILHELYKDMTEENITEVYEIENTLHALRHFLLEENLPEPEQPWPGKQMYKVSVIKLILCIGRYSNFLQTIHNGQSRAFEIWSRLLVTPEAEVQSIAWSTVSEVLTKEHDSEQRMLLRSHAILAATNFTENLHTFNPDMLDALFEFLYNCLMNANEWFLANADDKKHEICTLILRRMHSHNSINFYVRRFNYLRLLGKCMVTLIHDITVCSFLYFYLAPRKIHEIHIDICFKDEELEREYKKDVYRKICNKRWISLLSEESRPSTFNILFDLFDADNINAEQCYPVLDWWTLILQLLVDDNMDIRCEACKLICRFDFEPPNRLECIQKMLLIFFQVFNNKVADKCPELAVSALFCWSVSLLGNINYQMGQADVFNKSRNYDIFESVRISNMCYDLMISIKERYSIDDILPLNVIQWINDRLQTNFKELSFKNIVSYYKNHVPRVKKESRELVDPTYKDKLLQVLAYEKYAML